MHKSTKCGLIFWALLVGVIVTILLVNLNSIRPTAELPSCVKLDGSATCHFTDPSPYRYYGTKTSYHIVAGNETESDLEIGECKPIAFYLLSRHATRYPDKEYIEGMIKLLPSLREKILNNSLSGKAKLCHEDIEKLKRWKLNMKVDDDKSLSSTGKAEAEILARHLKEKFPSILNDTYSSEKFTIEYTSRKRTRVTAESFAKGLFDKDSKKIDFDGKENDKILNFHKSCKKLRDPSYDTSEVDKFDNGALMKKVVDSVSQRVGVTLTKDDIKLIYTSCVFDYALNNSDAWCSLFSSDDLQVLEFSADIDDYYSDAYGNEVNYKQACPVAKYIFDFMKKSTENSNDTKVVLHFSHAGAIKKVYALFGLYQDELPLTADAFCSEKNRKWRSSYIVPFNSNIVFVLYQCGQEYKVATLHNEKPVRINGCEHKLCSFTKFSSTYEPISKDCNVNEICCTCCIKAFYRKKLPIALKRSNMKNWVLAAIVISLVKSNTIKGDGDIKSCLKLDRSETCHSTNPFPYRYYGSRTSYHIATENQTESDLDVGECKPVMFYFLSRHATRYPDKETIEGMMKSLPSLKEKIINNYLAGKAKMCNEDIENLKKWKLKMKPEDEKILGATGEVEAENLGRRLKEKFSWILNDKYSPEKFIIEYTSKNRTRDTAESFAKGLFGDDYKNIDFEGKTNDKLLTFYKYCKTLLKKCNNFEYDKTEIKKFDKGPLMKEVVKSVSQRIGVTLTNEDVKLIHNACMFEYALDYGDPWCSLFTNEELEVLEFGGDIYDYYTQSYGRKVNTKQACPVLKNILDMMKSTTKTNPKVVLQFSHWSALTKVYAMLGLNQDELPLKADAFCSQKNRKWRSSFIAPFNSNIAFVLYKCTEEHKVAVYQNEKAMKINGCKHKLCTFKEFFLAYQPISEECNIDKICCPCCKN
ncbi:hypothetical protein CEXT_303621 [Caerostris extrusa]|uniref:Multiple inositol polyphosphate phosphatase 1 n=1 Tax=Caerostris extrusa TaxID=172846 RepID=A0AAV4RVZ5_CAEEX|nr:hypothetical protein CEXT_303621 [Caerostris extrusa]